MNYNNNRTIKPIKITSRFTHKEMDKLTSLRELLDYTEMNNAYFLEVISLKLANKITNGDDLWQELNINNHKLK